MRIFTCSVLGVTPFPLHCEHGVRRRPVPSQSGHGCENCRRPPLFITCPVPLQVGQVITGPPVSPAPRQREHCSLRLTVILVVKPLNDSSKLRARGISISRPFFGSGLGGSGSRRGPALPLPPKRSEKISRKLEPPLPLVVPG